MENPIQEENNSEKQVLYPNVYSKNDFIVIERNNEKGENIIEEIARDIKLEELKRNIDTNEIVLVLEATFNDKVIKKEISREMLNKRRLIELQKYGFDVFDGNCKYIIQHIRNQEEQLEVDNIHTSVGYGEYEKKQIFKLYEAIGYESQYAGKLGIKPKGNYETWNKMVRKHVVGNVNLELSIAEGLSAAVIGMIGKSISLDTLLIHKYNDSSKGKTTALMLALSCFGCPDPKVSPSLAGTWLATDNALTALLNNNFGIPVGLDELSMSGNSNFTRIVYALAGGKDKARLDKDANLKNTAEWSTTVISTGEFSILSKANKNMGLRMRVIEEGNIQWTPDAKTSDIIKNVATKNYGHAGIIFVEKLFEMGKKDVIKSWKVWSEDLFDSIIEKDDFSRRISAKLAVIMVTAEIAKEALELDFDLAGIQKLLIENEKSCKEDRDIGMSAYNFFVEQFNINKSHFEIASIIKTQNGNKLENKEIWGSNKELDDGTIEVCVIPSIFKKLMKDGGYEDANVILQNWKSRGLISFEEGHNTRKRKINTTKSIPVYCIIIKDIVEEKEER